MTNNGSGEILWLDKKSLGNQKRLSFELLEFLKKTRDVCVDVHWDLLCELCGLQCVSVCCILLRCGAAWCSVLHCCNVLQCVAVCCSVLQCVAVCCSVLQSLTGHVMCVWMFIGIYCLSHVCVTMCVAVCVAVCCSVANIAVYCSQWWKFAHISFCKFQHLAVCCNVLYRVAKTHRIPYLYRSFFAKETYI